MRAIIGRLRRLEGHLTSAPREYFQIVVARLDRKRSLVNARYSASPGWSDGTLMEVIRLDRDPDARVAVTEEELERWIQKQRQATGWEAGTAR